MAQKAQNVGIKAIEIYFPSQVCMTAPYQSVLLQKRP